VLHARHLLDASARLPFQPIIAMLGLLAWYKETNSPELYRLLERHADGLMRVAVDHGDYAYFPKYEYDGKEFVDDPKGKDAPVWYGGRLILPLVEYWQISQRAEVKSFIEKLIRYCTEVSHFIKADGEVERGEGWWGHLHSTMDMTAGIAEFGRLTNRPELVAWAKRIYDWIGALTRRATGGWRMSRAVIFVRLAASLRAFDSAWLSIALAQPIRLVKSTAISGINCWKTSSWTFLFWAR